MNVRPGLNFEISVQTISGLLSLGYQIGAIMHRCVRRVMAMNAGSDFCTAPRRRGTTRTAPRSRWSLFRSWRNPMSKSRYPVLGADLFELVLTPCGGSGCEPFGCDYEGAAAVYA
jgi:hypothetical protein